MRLGRPRTLLELILMGFALVTLPLLVGVANAVIKLGQLAAESESVSGEIAAATEENQRIAGLLTDMDRNARQYLVLQDRSLLELYQTGHTAFQQSLAVLETLPRTEEIAAQISTLKQRSQAVQNVVHRGASESALAVVEENFRTMIAAATVIARGMRVLINERLSTLQEDTVDAQRTLAWQTAALLPGTGVLILFFVVLVGRPMRQVDRAIRELGKGDFGHPIEISGPTDIETLGRQLEWLRHRLKESTDEKNKFLRHMSHELKTPLANIREGTELLLDGSVGRLDPQQQEVTGILRDNGIKLQKLIENLLTFSAWQTNTASLEISEFEIKPLIFKTLSQHRLVIANRKLKLHLTVNPLVVRADEGKLRLVLENLLSNAIKFTPVGGTIHIGAVMHGGTLVIDLADTGPGIAPEDAERIFEAFYQGRRLHGGPVGGTGIGLSVVLECVQAHGGSIERIEGEWPGAHFRVQLPLRRASDRPALVVNA
jgi:two-component system, NtrC family, sensor histidine kinase GlrK